MMTATMVRRLSKAGADQALYKLNPKLQGHEYVVLSGLENEHVHEVVAFPADRDGMITSYLYIVGIDGTTDHGELIRELGYEEVG